MPMHITKPRIEAYYAYFAGNQNINFIDKTHSPYTTDIFGSNSADPAQPTELHEPLLCGCSTFNS